MNPMRRLSLIPLLWLAAATVHAEPRRPLTLPIRVPGSAVPSPAYAGDVVTVRLTPNAARTAWQSRGLGASAARVGVPALDRAGAELGIRWEPEFPGWRPPELGSRQPDLSAFYTAHLAPGVDLTAALDRLSALAEVASADPVAILPMSTLPPSDSLFSVSYWYQQASRRDLHALEAWAITTGDTSIVVGILDTGVLAFHPDIGGDSIAVYMGQPSQIYTNWAEANGVPGVDDDQDGYVDDVHGWDFVNLTSPNDAATGEDWQSADNDPSDFAAHGTAVSGVVGALSDNVHGVTGTSWNVRLLPLRVGWACYGTGTGCGEVRMDFAAQAIAYAAMKKLPVINCSFESLGTPDLIAALDAALNAGVTVVAAAGNDGQPVQFTNNFLSERPEVLSTASIGPSDGLSPFTNYGPEIDLCAPGEAIASTWLARNPTAVPAYHPNLSGTSIAAPFVTGAAALVQARQRQLGLAPMTPEGVILRLEETADDIGAVNGGRVGQYGAGRVNLGRAVSETWRSTATRIGEQISGSMAWVGLSGGAGSRIVFATVDNHVVILNTAKLDTVAVAPLPRPPTTGVTIGPLSTNGGVGLFVGCQGGVSGFHPNGTTLPHWPALIAPTVQVVGGPTVGDLDGDGAYELICGTDDGRVCAWHIADPTNPVTGFPAQVTSGGAVYIALAHPPSGSGLMIVAAADDGTVEGLGADGQPVSAAWQMSLGAAPTAPAVTTWGGTETVILGAGSQLHAFLPDGSERTGFPADLGAYPITGEEPAIGDIDLDGSDDVVIATTAPDRLDVRDSSGQSKIGSNWPRTLDSYALGSPVIGQLAPDAPPEIMLMLVSGLTAFSSTADSLPNFPKYGGAGHRPTLIDVDGDGTTEVLAGSGGGLPSRAYIYDAGTGTAASPVKPWITFRGNFARTGSRAYAPYALIDVTPPGAITDLRAAARANGWTLLWTAPTDEGPSGRAATYDLRRSSQPITESNFAAATPMTAGAPSAAGQPDSASAGAVTAGQPVYFAVRAQDSDGNTGAVSNSVGIQLPATQLALAPKPNPSHRPAILDWQADPRAVGLRQALRIHDLTGRAVRTIELGTGSGGTANWDGKDDDGRRLPAGLYLVRLISGKYHAQTRLVLLP